MANIGPREHCKEWFVRYGLLTLPSLYIYTSLIKLHKEANIFVTHSNIHDHHTRNRDNLVIPRSRLNMSKANKLDVKLYNNLPVNIRNLSLMCFKTQLKIILVRNCYYSVEEYLKVKIVIL